MSAPVDIKPAAPKRPRRSVKPQLMVAKSLPAFEMTAEEQAWAVRFFSACRRMSEGSRRNCMIFADVAEEQAKNWPLRPAAKLQLVSGGAQ